MKCKVVLYLDGKVWNQTVQARDYQDAKQICLRQNSSKVKVLSVSAVFR